MTSQYSTKIRTCLNLITEFNSLEDSNQPTDEVKAKMDIIGETLSPAQKRTLFKSMVKKTFGVNPDSPPTLSPAPAPASFPSLH